ncbi:MAG: hypothetical protein AAGN35_08175 [Bacteroidota bacterium]
MCSWGQSAPLRISLRVPETARQSPIVRHAVADAQQLLAQACQCDVAVELPEPTVILQMPDLDPAAVSVPSTFAEGRDYPYFHYPQHSYRWSSVPTSVRNRTLWLETTTPQGVSMGLYGLLQEQLGFRFVHPRQTIVPEIVDWPLPPKFKFSGTPTFDKKGFHLHTQHPLELTEPLHNPDFPGGAGMIETYLQWLARNGQNFFEFSLLEGVQLARWVPYAREWVRFAHERGILCSVDLSLHMVQQRAYKLVEFPPASLKSFERQIDDKLEQLLSAGWDFVNLEFAMAEFVGGMEKLRHRLRAYATEAMARYPQVKLIGRQHVVKPEDEIGGGNKIAAAPVANFSRGVLIHTVMCYAVTDGAAPVYELKNFRHLYEMLISEDKVRETWYYPESAYWITFDNSVPMLLLPYLSARLRDIETMRRLKIPGHITFSSGWEWGYWLVDWSIARWSWNYAFNGNERTRQPLGPLFSIDNFNRDLQAMQRVLHLQEIGMAENILRYLCPENIPDAFPPPGNKQFQPRLPEKTAVWAKDFPVYDPAAEPYTSLRVLRGIADGIALALDSMRVRTRFCCEDPLVTGLAVELLDAVEVTQLRMRHRIETVSALGALAVDDTLRNPQFPRPVQVYLNQAHGLRRQAQAIVDRREMHYRYPLELIARPRRSYTAYAFGYLYPVSDLFWWRREEAQIREERFGPFFMNPWDLRKIVGLKK